MGKFKEFKRRSSGKSKLNKKGGPFGIFVKKLKHKDDPIINQTLKNLQEQLLECCMKYRELSMFRIWNFFKKMPLHKQGILRYKRFIEDKNHRSMAKSATSTAILNYYLFKQLPDSEKEKLSQIYQERYMLPITEKFNKEYLKRKRIEHVRKTDFILWMNHYLENNVSDEFLELSSFEIALKLGQLWNELPYKERKEWRLLALEDENWRSLRRHRIFKEESGD